MKIAFIGSHGVGKTGLAWTLAGHLKKEGHNVELLPEAARIIADSGYKINEGSNEKSQNMILSKQILLENNYSTKYEVIVCDRSVIDNFIYLLRVLKNKKLNKKDFDKKLKIYETKIKKHLVNAPYDYIFYVPAVKSTFNKNDSYRSKNIKFREEIDLMLQDYLNKSKILFSIKETRYIALPKKNPRTWNRLVRETLKL